MSRFADCDKFCLKTWIGQLFIPKMLFVSKNLIMSINLFCLTNPAPVTTFNGPADENRYAGASAGGTNFDQQV